MQAKTSLKARYTLVFLETKLPSVMNISDIWVFFGIAKSLGMFMLNREYAIKDFENQGFLACKMSYTPEKTIYIRARERKVLAPLAPHSPSIGHVLRDDVTAVS